MYWITDLHLYNLECPENKNTRLSELLGSSICIQQVLNIFRIVVIQNQIWLYSLKLFYLKGSCWLTSSFLLVLLSEGLQKGKPFPEMWQKFLHQDILLISSLTEAVEFSSMIPFKRKVSSEQGESKEPCWISLMKIRLSHSMVVLKKYTCWHLLSLKSQSCFLRAKGGRWRETVLFVVNPFKILDPVS